MPASKRAAGTGCRPRAGAPPEAVAALREPEMARRIAGTGSPDVAGAPEAFRAPLAAGEDGGAARRRGAC